MTVLANIVRELTSSFEATMAAMVVVQWLRLPQWEDILLLP